LFPFQSLDKEKLKKITNALQLKITEKEIEDYKIAAATILSRWLSAGKYRTCHNANINTAEQSSNKQTNKTEKKKNKQTKMNKQKKTNTNNKKKHISLWIFHAVITHLPSPIKGQEERMEKFTQNKKKTKKKQINMNNTQIAPSIFHAVITHLPSPIKGQKERMEKLTQMSLVGDEKIEKEQKKITKNLIDCDINGETVLYVSKVRYFVCFVFFSVYFVFKILKRNKTKSTLFIYLFIYFIDLLIYLFVYLCFLSLFIYLDFS
jgi:hypothetical protein